MRYPSSPFLWGDGIFVIFVDFLLVIVVRATECAESFSK